MNTKLNKVSFDDLNQASNPYAIRNFIVPEGRKPTRNFSFDETYLFEGIIFAVCIRGNGRVKINFREHKITSNTLIVIAPGQIVDMIEKSDDLMMKPLFFSIDFIMDFPFPRDFDIFYTIRKKPCIEITDEVKQELLDSYAFIQKQYNKTDLYFREKIVQAQLFSLMLEISSIYYTKKEEGNKYSSRQEELAERFLRLLAEHHKEERTVSFYADKLCVTGKHLSSTIKTVTGKSLMRWVNDITIVVAKVMLRTTNKTALEISEELNFPNPSFFGRFFKQHVGMSPLEYRKKSD